MSMIDDASDETKDAVKRKRRRERTGAAEPASADGSAGETGSAGKDTDGDVPVANLE